MSRGHGPPARPPPSLTGRGRRPKAKRCTAAVGGYRGCPGPGAGDEGLFRDLSRYIFPGPEERLHGGALGPFRDFGPVPGGLVEPSHDRRFHTGTQEGWSKRIDFPTLRPVVAHKPLVARIAFFGVGGKPGQSPVCVSSSVRASRVSVICPP